jgi:hypothetical protein
MLSNYTAKPVKFQGQLYEQRHGGPFDRGAADSYYHRGFGPHYYVGDTGSSRRVELADMTAEEIVAYTAGYNWNEQHGDKKDWS